MLGLEWSPCPVKNSDGILNLILISVVTFSFTLKYSVSLHIEFQNLKIFLGILLL